ncbi:MAG: alpha-glucosidase/alpha-galactosidase [Caldilineaceae bacterium]|nr:alpha-glucosidase/alpha-galactosidase [Caldilineaceae bacterium]MCB9156764.1 alpha-glucosidase/alpha-galactosidase [Caldilineaceae bacterium]
MPTPIKIAVIGAGSATFSLGLVKDLCLTPNLAGSFVHFMDINEERLPMITKLAQRYSQELGQDLRIESTTDRHEALRDADFVINTADAKGHYHAAAMRDIIAKHGYYYSTGASVPGSYYNFNLMMSVVRDMEEICPDAWLIQSGNPVFSGCTLMTRESDIKIIGLCHGHYGVYGIARTLGLEINSLKDLTWQAPGLNHNVWLTFCYYRGQDMYPMIDEWIETKADEYWRTHVPERTHDIQMSKGAIHQYMMYGLMPIGDTVRSGQSWWYHTDLATKQFWFFDKFGGPDTDIARPQYVKGLEEKLAMIKRLASDPKASVVQELGQEKTREQQVPIIDALVNNVEEQFEVNIPNNGVLAGIPDDVVVEVPAIINKGGVFPMQVEPLPPKVMYEMIYPNWLAMERELLAYKTGDRTQLIWNALQSNKTHSYEQAVALVKDVMGVEGHEEVDEFFKFVNGESAMLMERKLR